STQGSGVFVKLPKADLPRFDGKFEDWLSFKDKFSSMIDSHESLSNVQKLQYLQSALSGEAASVIKALATTDANYVHAWQFLEGTYANERLIVTRHVDLLVQAAPVIKETASNLRAFVNHVQQHLRSLKTLQVPVEHWDALLLSILRPKLALQTKLAFDSTLKDKELPRIQMLLQFLTQRARSLETTSATSADLEPSMVQKKTASPTFPRRHVPSNSSPRKQLPKVFATSTKTSQIDCFHCKRSGHAIYRCEAFHALSVKERIQAAKRASLCSNCLRKGHTAEQCNSSCCRFCDGQHHTLLHVLQNHRETSPPPRSKDDAPARAGSRPT
ncbi:uncharacterized protein LOC144477625, partial [Augochlora pura]